MSLSLLAIVVVLGWLWKRGLFDHEEENEVTPACRTRIFEAAVRAAVKQEQEFTRKADVVDVSSRRSALTRVGVR